MSERVEGAGAAGVWPQIEWALSLALARYCYGEHEWVALDPEERNAIAEPYLWRAIQMAPMVAIALGLDTHPAQPTAAPSAAGGADGGAGRG